MAVKAKAETTIVDMTDAYSVILSSETYTFIGGTAGAQSGLSCATDVTAFCGTNLCSKVQIGTITCPTGITATVSNNNTTTPTITFKTTATISAACEATIPVVVDGITVNKKFSFAVAKTGATGAKGDKGDTGATGKGIKSTSITYQAGTSQTTAPTGTWSTSIPATSTSTPYLWTKTVITYDDNTTSTSYSVSSTLDSLEIGGRNLLLNTNFLYEQTKDTTNTNHGTNVYVDKKHLSNMIGKKITFSYYVHSPGSRDTSLTSNANMKNRFGMHGAITWSDSTGVKTSTRMQYPFDSYLLASIERSRVVMQMTVTPPDGYDTIESFVISVQTYAKPASDNEETWEIGYPKLEYGTKATDWTPAPEDLASSDDLDSLTTRVVSAESNITQLSNKITAEVSERTALGTRVSTVEQTASGLTTRLMSAESNISTAQSTANTARSEAANAAKTATNYMNFSSDGLVIGDMTASTLGKNVLIDSDSVNIRNGTNTVATFAEDLIELGKNSAQTVIKLCGGTGKIKSDTVVHDSYTYSSLEISSDYLTRIRAGNGEHSVIAVSSESLIEAIVTYDSGVRNYVQMFPSHTYIDKPVYFGNHIVLPNNTALYGNRTNGGSATLVHLGADNNVHLGYNTIDLGDGETHIHGQDIRFRIGTAGVSYKPYYGADIEDGESGTWVTDGYITGSGLRVYFTIPLGKPVIGSPTVTVSSFNGLMIRQNGKYLYGSSADTYALPDSYTAKVVGGNCIRITAVFSNTTNVTNNDVCGIFADIAFSFE